MSLYRSLSLSGVMVAGMVVVALSNRVKPAPLTVSSEIARIKQHIAAAERLMAARDLSGLTQSQRDARQVLVATLDRYREVGRFPHNHDFTERVPYFVDEHGTLCAVGYLIASTGRWDLVDAVREKMNNGRVHEIAADPDLGSALSGWLVEHGITLSEAAAIQPWYDPCEFIQPCPPPRRTTVDGAYAAASVGTYGASALGLIANAMASSNSARSGWPALSIISGAGAFALSIPELDERGSRHTWAVTNIGVGLASIVAGTVAWITRPDATPANGRVVAHADTDSYGRSRFGLRVRF